MNFQSLETRTFDSRCADENQRVLNDLYARANRARSGVNLIYTGALRDPHAPICFRLDEASEISGFSTCNSTDRRGDCISYPNERRFDRIGSRLCLGYLLSLKTCNEAFVMRAIRMQMLAGILLQEGPRRDDFDLYTIERVNLAISLPCGSQTRSIRNFSFFRYDETVPTRSFCFLFFLG